MNEVDPIQIRTVLCAFDFSETAERALDQALRFARRHRARLVLAHVVEPVTLGPDLDRMTPIDELSLRDIVAKRIEARADALREDGTPVDRHIEAGQPGPTLVAMAESLKADLVVVGTRGLTGLEHLMLGSTAEHVIRRCHCPVLTVHPGDRVLDGSIQTVVLPTDLSEHARHAVRTFIALFADSERPRVHLVYADRTPPYLEPFRHETLEKMNQRDVVKERIEQKLAPVAEGLRKAGFEVEVDVLDGDPVTVTTRVAKKLEADLIMLSTRGRSALLNTLLGRTAQRIVQYAPCPVLTVRAARPRRSSE